MRCFKRTALKHVYYLGWNRSPAQAGCMRQVLGPGALGRPRGIGWRGRWEGGSGWGMHVTPWLIHVNVWQNPLPCCEVISLRLIKINEKKKTNKITTTKNNSSSLSIRFTWKYGFSALPFRTSFTITNKKKKKRLVLPLWDPRDWNYYNKKLTSATPESNLCCYWPLRIKVIH